MSRSLSPFDRRLNQPRSTSLGFFTLLALVVPLHAQAAPPVSLTAAIALVPAETDTVTSIQVQPLINWPPVASSVIEAMLGTLQGDIGLIKGTCKVDPRKEIKELTLFLQPDNTFVATIALSTWKEASFTKCVTEVAKAKEAGALQIRKDDGLTAYQLPDQDPVFVKWLGKGDVVAIASKSNEKAHLLRLLAGKGLAGGRLKPALAAVNTAATAWAVTTRIPSVAVGNTSHKPVDALLSLDLVADAIRATARVSFAKAEEAATLTLEAQQLRQSILDGGTPEEQALASPMVVTQDGLAVLLTTTLSSEQFFAVLPNTMQAVAAFLAQLPAPATTAEPPAEPAPEHDKPVDLPKQPK